MCAPSFRAVLLVLGPIALISDGDPYSGSLVHKLDSFHDSGHKPSLDKNQIKFDVDFMGNFDSVLFRCGLRPELWRELSLQTGTTLLG